MRWEKTTKEKKKKEIERMQNNFFFMELLGKQHTISLRTFIFQI